MLMNDPFTYSRKFCCNRALLIALPVIATLIGCVTAPDAERRWEYVCLDGYEFGVDIAGNGNSLVFTDPEQELKLDLKETASGARFTDGSFVLWCKGQLALIRRDGETLHENCMGDYDAPED
jgi:membrane-bound inhibitor of C-type lysozyme